MSANNFQDATFGEPIAIVGSSCRFAGGISSPSKLWELIAKPKDVLGEIPDSRFHAQGFYHPDSDIGHSNVKHAYTLEEDHRLFDAAFFNISANEASAMDPQQRILLECVYEAIESGGHRTDRLKSSDTAVFVGVMLDDYSAIHGRELNMMPKVCPTTSALSRRLLTAGSTGPPELLAPFFPIVCRTALTGPVLV